MKIMSELGWPLLLVAIMRPGMSPTIRYAFENLVDFRRITSGISKTPSHPSQDRMLVGGDVAGWCRISKKADRGRRHWGGRAVA